jgi:predicted phosphodiesterase
MSVAALYDIHGNLPALRAVLADAAREGVSDFVIGGDVASGPLPAETIDQVMALAGPARFVRGNADREVVQAYDRQQTDLHQLEDPTARASAFAAGQISRSQRDFLDGFIPTVDLSIAGLGSVLFCHGTPRSDTKVITSLTPEDRMGSILAEVEQSVVVCGHTHQQFDRAIGGTRVVNAGSVGLPYEGRPGAYWALLGPDVELRRTEYDLSQAVGELRTKNFPDLDEMLNESLLAPRDRDDLTAFFERLAAGDQAGY